MSEHEWLTSTDPVRMLHWLCPDPDIPGLLGVDLDSALQRSLNKTRPTDRKLRLFACACCRQVWDALEERSRRAVEDSELFADGVGQLLQTEDIVSLTDAVVAAQHIVKWAGRGGFPARDCGPALQAALLRDIVGNPFRKVKPLWCQTDDGPVPTELGFAWLTPRGKAAYWLALSIYEERAFDRMPILADALEEAGANCQELLTHLRSPDPHVRGCWAIDLMLGKS